MGQRTSTDVSLSWQIFGPIDDQAWERAHHYYTNTFREKGYSDIQAQAPVALEDLECTF